ncbi:SgcJ/EcaC family oxidoreductase [Sphaerisporangium aureirubrum]|uniref:SgcJ/EcaC family oxidoreductase n=1 Tax=Sphaerisporangium aureirubrum TaxID=1544736 RepID=A0ABW1N957_9ACTN
MGIRRHGRNAISLVIAGGLGLAVPGTGGLAVPGSEGLAVPGTAAAASITTSTPHDDVHFASPAWHNPTDLVAFARIRQQQETAWARGDAKGYAAIYTPDADLVNILGEHLHSRQTITTKLQQYFNTQLKNTRLLEMDEKIRFVSPTMAIIVRKSCVLYNKEKACRPDTLSINTNVAVKSSGQWQIASFQNTLIRPRP